MIRRLLDRVTRPLVLPEDRDARARTLLDIEWLVTNGFGGYASSTTAGVVTRRYHGILVAALPNPIGRVLMLNHLGERLVRSTRRLRRAWRPFDSTRAYRSGNTSGARFVSRSEC